MNSKGIQGIASVLLLLSFCLFLTGCEETWYTIDPENFQTWEYFTTQNGLGSDSVTCLAEDNKGNIWVGTLDNGVSKYDFKGWTIYNKENGLLDNTVWCIAQDGNKFMWFGTNKGLSILANGTWTHIDEFGCVYALMKDYNNNMWVSSENHAVLEWDRHQWISWYDVGCDLCNYVNVFFEDKERNIWFGTWDGLRKFTNGSSTFYNAENGYPGGVVRSIYQDYWGYLWIGVSEASSVIRYSNGTFEEVSLSNGFQWNYISSISSDNEENLWFAADSRGAVKYNGSLMKTYTAKDGLPGNIVITILKDRFGYLWFGTIDGGVARYMPGLD
jgi:ligand-binding sensor domain-containing protein